MLTCPKCNVDSPRNDYQFCLNCGGDLEMRTVVRKAEAKRVSPMILVSVAAAILGLLIGTAIVASNVSQTVKSSEAPNGKTYSDEYFAKVTPTPTSTPHSVLAVPTETPRPVESDRAADNVDQEDLAVNRTQRRRTTRNNFAANAANSAANNVDRRRVEAPPNMIAFCVDGSYSFEPKSWACADRGGAVKWYVSGIDDSKRPRAICNDGHLSYWRYDRWATCGTGGGVRFWYY